MPVADEGTTVYIDDGGSSQQPPPSSIMDGMVDFARSAAEGGFEVSPAGGEAMLKAIDDFQHWVDTQSHRIRMLEQERKLGSSNAAQVMAPFTQQVVSDEQGFITQLRVLRESLNKASEGIRTAMENYRRTEENARSNLGNIET